MTNEEAIIALKRIRKDWQFTYSYDCEAVEIAISALSADGDLISRQAVLDSLYELCDTGESLKENPWRDNPHIDALIETIEQIPSEEKTAEWIVKDGIVGVAYCSKCDYELHTDNTNYCPNCGSRMKGDTE